MLLLVGFPSNTRRNQFPKQGRAGGAQRVVTVLQPQFLSENDTSEGHKAAEATEGQYNSTKIIEL